MNWRKRIKKFFKNFSDKGFPYIFFLINKNLLRLDIYFIYPFAIVGSLIIILIRPFFFIRFGFLFAAKIGPLSALPEINLCEKEHSIQPKNSFDIYGVQKSSFICNTQLFKMWRRKLRVWDNSIYFYKVLNFLPGGKKHTIKPTDYSRDVHGLLQNSKKHLSFLNEESVLGEKLLDKMGLKDKKFILMINRSQRYLDEVHNFDIDFDYHSYRNSPINLLLPAAEILTKSGYHVIRVGHLVGDKIISKNNKIIDYDNDGHRSEFLDIYLASKCEYIFGTDTGYFAIPGWNFRKPILYVNFSQLEYIEPWLSSWLMIFKKYWLINEKRFLTIKEILSSGVGRFHRTEEFKNSGIELIDNTKEEIIDANLEMTQRINGEWVETDEEKDLQKIFWKQFEESNLHGNFLGKIGSKFLKQNKKLFIN